MMPDLSELPHVQYSQDHDKSLMRSACARPDGGVRRAQADAVERFVVVHGQILLNQFRHFPNKAVARSAFVGALKERMAQRRHHVLYSAPRAAARLRGLRANPMRDRASGRAKPMTATATAMVRAVWQSYFSLAAAAAGVATWTPNA